MNKERLKNIAVVLLLTLTVFSVFKYAVSVREKYNLSQALEKAKIELGDLENQRQNLLRDLEKEKERGEALSRKNSELKNYLSACRKRMSRLFSDLREAEDNLEDLGSRYSLIKAENIALRKDKTRLKLVSEENENLKIILTSVEELKKIIRELKRQKRQAAREGGALEGNLGYVIKGGKPSCPPKIIIEVIPAPSPKRDEGNIPANSSE